MMERGMSVRGNDTSSEAKHLQQVLTVEGRRGEWDKYTSILASSHVPRELSISGLGKTTPQLENHCHVLRRRCGTERKRKWRLHENPRPGSCEVVRPASP